MWKALGKRGYNRHKGGLMLTKKIEYSKFKSKKIDKPIVKLIEQLNSLEGVETFGSCSGHTKNDHNIHINVLVEYDKLRDFTEILNEFEREYGSVCMSLDLCYNIQMMNNIFDFNKSDNIVPLSLSIMYEDYEERDLLIRGFEVAIESFKERNERVIGLSHE